jgi:DNA-directed RNA polymerase specialized sigma24 family protein
MNKLSVVDKDEILNALPEPEKLFIELYYFQQLSKSEAGRLRGEIFPKAHSQIRQTGQNQARRNPQIRKGEDSVRKFMGTFEFPDDFILELGRDCYASLHRLYSLSRFSEKDVTTALYALEPKLVETFNLHENAKLSIIQIAEKLSITETEAMHRYTRAFVFITIACNKKAKELL